MKYMKPTFFLRFFITLLVCSTTSTQVLADVDTQNLIAGYGTSQNSQTALVAAPADTLVVPEGTAQSMYLPTPINPLAITQTQQSLANFFALNPGANTINTIIANTINNVASFGPSNASVPSSVTLYASCAASSVTGGMTNCLQSQATQPFTNVDLNTLIGPLAYQSNQSQAALSFIQSIASLNSTIPLVDLNKMATSSNTSIPALIANNADVAQYVNDLRAYAALQAVGMSTLYQLYAERQPTSLSQTSNPALYQALSAIGMPNASQLQVENYMATRRITNPDWVASLSNDGPAALLRQIVILLAENLTESYNNRMATERLTAIMSALELEQNAATMRIAVNSDVTTLTSAQTSSGGGGG